VTTLGLFAAPHRGCYWHLDVLDKWYAVASLHAVGTSYRELLAARLVV
jgi:hypothetical protein